MHYSPDCILIVWLAGYRIVYDVNEGECTATNTAATAGITGHIGQPSFACFSAV